MDESSSVRVIIRAGTKEDHPLIYATWRKSAFYSVPRRTKDDAKEFFRTQTAIIREILKNADVLVACLEDDPTTILGYSVTTGEHLDWVYVKTEFRKKGIGTILFPKETKTVTNQLTWIGASIAQKKFLTVRGEVAKISREEQKEN